MSEPLIARGTAGRKGTSTEGRRAPRPLPVPARVSVNESLSTGFQESINSAVQELSERDERWGFGWQSLHRP
jgi:hypothetical protein